MSITFSINKTTDFKMKNINSVLTYVAIVAIIVLFILQLKPEAKSTAMAAEKSSVAALPASDRLPVAYVNTDSLLLHYQLAIDLNEELLKQQEEARTNLNEEARVLESKVVEHQRKIQNNGYLNLDRARAEEQRLQDMNNRLTDMGNKLSNEIAEKQMQVSEQLRDSIVNYLEEYNKGKNFELILSNTIGGNVLYAKKVYNITEEVLNDLNKRYN